MTASINIDALGTEGFVEGWADLDRESVLRVFSVLGKPVSGNRHSELVRDIQPRLASEAPLNTLSSRYGLAQFPFHTDGAHWVRPPRYLVLYCLNPGSGSRTTRLLSPLESCGSEELAPLRRDVWRVAGVKRPFLARILDGVCGTEFLRFDAACMTSLKASAPSRAVIQTLIARTGSRTIEWEPSKFLVIDNWRALHARGPAKKVDCDRHHLRLLLE